MGEILLETKKLSKHFGGIIANEKIDFHIDRGEIVAIIGPNGSGKTTFYNLLTGITPSTSGSIWFEGKNITKKKPEQITKLGICRTFQNIRLFGAMSVAENILVARHCRTNAGLTDAVVNSRKKQSEEAACRDIVSHCMDYVGISEMRDVKARLLRIQEAYNNPDFSEEEHIRIGFAVDRHKKNIKRLEEMIIRAKADHKELIMEK